MKKEHIVRHGVPNFNEHSELPLSVTLMSNVRNESNKNNDESTTFDSETHVRHIEQVYQFLCNDARN